MEITIVLFVSISKHLIVIGDPGGGDPDQVEELLGLAAQQCLEIADEPVDVPLARSLGDDVLVVVVSEASRKFFVIHFGFVLALAPASRHLVKNRRKKLSLTNLHFGPKTTDELIFKALIAVQR